MDKKNELLLKKFGQHAKAVRDEKGLSLNQVAANCKLTNPKVSIIESGRVNATFLTIVELAKGLGVRPKELFEFIN